MSFCYRARVLLLSSIMYFLVYFVYSHLLIGANIRASIVSIILAAIPHVAALFLLSLFWPPSFSSAVVGGAADELEAGRRRRQAGQRARRLRAGRRVLGDRERRRAGGGDDRGALGGEGRGEEGGCGAGRGGGS